MSWLRRLLSDQRGFTMISVVTGMMVIGMFSVGAWTAAVGDIPVGRKDQDRKRALEAAKAGVEWYTYHLLRDTNYWTYCSYQSAANPSPLPGVNIQGVKTSTRTLPNSQAKFAVELLSATGSTYTRSQCIANPGLTLLNSGVLRIRVTGTAGGKSRQLVATFRRNSFLDYLWYTKWETLPPAAYPDDAFAWASANCDQRRSERWQAAVDDGRTTGTPGTSNGPCADQNWISADSNLGPMHTEDDSFRVCSSPTFGRQPSDNVEVVLATSNSNAYMNRNCSTDPNVDTSTTGTTIPAAKSLDLPPTNAGLEVLANHVTTGQTCLTFNAGGTVTVRSGMSWSGTINCDAGGSTATYSLGTNTIIFTKNGATSPLCTAKYNPRQKYDNATSCGDVAVRGTYAGNVTIAAANDIILVDDLVKPNGGDQMMGLIAQNFVRVYHPAAWNSDGSACLDSGVSNTTQVSTVEAAILSLTASWIVDNWSCGDSLGALTVKGNIAQRWRGTVGQGSGGSVGSGYSKDYQYDDRLKYRQPPQFLDPVKASWHILRQSEQTPVQ